MPLQSNAGKSYPTGAGTGAAVAREKPKPFDPYDAKAIASLEPGVKSKLDPEDNPFSRLAPPPKDRYQLKCFAIKDGFVEGKGKNGDLYYAASIECRIVNCSVAEYNDAIVYPRAFYSSVGRGRKISTMAAMLIKWGYGAALEKKGYELTEKEVMQLFAMALKKEPTVYADLDWEGQFNAGTKEKSDYKVVFRSMEDFPQDDAGNYMHSVTVSDGSGGMAEVNARLKVVEWIGKNNSPETQVIKVVEAEPEVVEKPKAAAKPKAEKVKVKEPEPSSDRDWETTA